MALSLPSEKILVNLAPADLVKEGSHFAISPLDINILSTSIGHHAC
jgi:predicted ATPase with chaperone activity